MVVSIYSRGLAAPPALHDACDDQKAVRFRRRVKLFKRAGMINDTGEIRVDRAVTHDELAEAYGLVHSVFVDQGYIRPQRGRMRVRAFEALPEMATFVAKAEDDRIVGVMSLLPDSDDLGVPSDKVFAEELDKLRMQGRLFGEITNLAVASDYRKSNVFLELTRYLYSHSANIGLDDLFIAISPGHAAFFEEILSFHPWGKCRDYGDTVVDLVEGKRLDLTTFESRMKEADELLGEQAFLHPWYFTNNRHFHEAALAAEKAADQFLDVRLLRNLFCHVSGLLHRCTLNELQSLRKRWGHELFAQIYAAETNVA